MFNYFTKRKIDDALIDELESALIATDMGMSSVFNILGKIRKIKVSEEISFEELKNLTKDVLKEDLSPYFNKKNIEVNKKPYVILVSGTNGSGKTTTIAKLANYLKAQYPKILLAPCDTFRAGASEQLQIWAEKIGVDFFLDPSTKDPAAIAYKAVEKSIVENYDLIIIDTSGRLDSNSNLMAELTKINGSIKKVYQSAPHSSLLVVDGTQGQIALSQANGFANAIDLTGLIITKLDSGAKGGILINMIKTLDIPIYFIGTGEKENDFQEFNLDTYIENLLSSPAKTVEGLKKEEITPLNLNITEENLSNFDQKFNNPSKEMLDYFSEADKKNNKK